LPQRSREGRTRSAARQEHPRSAGGRLGRYHHRSEPHPGASERCLDRWQPGEALLRTAGCDTASRCGTGGSWPRSQGEEGSATGGKKEEEIEKPWLTLKGAGVCKKVCPFLLRGSERSGRKEVVWQTLDRYS